MSGGPRSRILVVDDEPALLRVCARALEAAGREVHTASNGREAVAMISEKSFEVIVTDITMPDMNGIQLLHAVREHDLDVPVILMTGMPTVETSVRAIEYGALRYLVKPFEAKVLCEVVAQAVRLHQVARLKRQALDLLGDRTKQVGDLAGLNASFDRALGSLWMAYQPIVSVATRKVEAFEALLRSEEASLPNPGAILEAAERLDRLPDLGRAIRSKIAGSVESAPAELVFVNLHPLDLLDEELYSASAPLSTVARRVVLEITERAALDDVHDATSRIAALRDLGFRIALDDLGAGYAGLTSFAQLEPDVVKFDMSLVSRVHEQPKKKVLIESMGRLFREMGIRVVAEGVECAEERDALESIGCDLLQGFFFGRPGRPFPPASL